MSSPHRFSTPLTVLCSPRRRNRAWGKDQMQPARCGRGSPRLQNPVTAPSTHPPHIPEYGANFRKKERRVGWERAAGLSLLVDHLPTAAPKAVKFKGPRRSKRLGGSPAAIETLCLINHLSSASHLHLF